MLNIFLSYHRDSEATAKDLVQDVKNLGHDVWFDRELSGGQVWWDKILSMIRQCDVLIFLLDPKSLDSTACQSEVNYAAALGKQILPILIAEGVSTNLLPTELSRIQYVDYRNQDRETAFSLARALSSLSSADALPDPLPSPPPVPVSYLGSLLTKLDSSADLTYAEQSEILLDLTRSSREPVTAKDTQILLERFRKRRDLYAAIAEEIDDLLKQATAARPDRHDSSPSGKPASAENKGLLWSAKGNIKWSLRLLTGLITGCVGAGIGAALLFSGPVFPHDWINGLLIYFSVYAVAGVISGPEIRAIRSTIILAIVGLLIWFMVDSGSKLLIRAFLFGAGGGAVIGAIIGCYLNIKARK